MHTQKTVKIFFLATIFLAPIYTVRFSVFGIPTNSLDLLLIVSIAIAVAAMKKEGWKEIVPNRRLVVGIALLLSGLILSAVVNPPYEHALGILKSFFVLPILFALFLRKVFGSGVKPLLFSYIASATVVSLVALVFYAAAGILTYDGRLAAWYGSPNFLAMYIAPALVLAWFSRDSFPQYIRGVPLTTFYLLHYTALYLIASYGALIAVAVAILFGELYKRKNSLQYISRIAFITLLLLISFTTLRWNSDKFRSVIQQDDRSSLSSREIIWRSALAIGRDHWILGIGPGKFQEKYLEYQTLYPPYLEWAVPQPHNLLLAFWLQTGLIGFLGFAWIIWSIVQKFFSEKVPGFDTQKKSLSLAIFCALLVILIHGIADTPIWKNDLALVFFVLLFSLSTNKPTK